MTTQSVTPAWQDKALYVAGVTMAAPLLAALFHLQVDPDKVASLVVAWIVPAVTFILAHKAKSGAILLAEIKHGVAQATGAVPLPAPLPTVAPAIPPVTP